MRREVIENQDYLEVSSTITVCQNTDGNMIVIEALEEVKDPFNYYIDEMKLFDNRRSIKGFLNSGYGVPFFWCTIKITYTNLDNMSEDEKHISCCCYKDSFEFIKSSYFRDAIKELKRRF